MTIWRRAIVLGPSIALGITLVIGGLCRSLVWMYAEPPIPLIDYGTWPNVDFLAAFLDLLIMIVTLAVPAGLPYAAASYGGTWLLWPSLSSPSTTRRFLVSILLCTIVPTLTICLVGGFAVARVLAGACGSGPLLSAAGVFWAMRRRTVAA